MSTEVKDQEIVLARGDMRMRVSPYGASLRGLWREMADGTVQEIATCYSGFDNKVGGQGDVMIPFPGRVREGRYRFDGTDYQLERNDKEAPAAIHGFLRFVPWEITDQAADSITFAASLGESDFAGYPFALHATIRYALTADGMTCHLTLRNTGARDAPVAAGFHPYFTVGSDKIDADTLHVPMSATLEFEGLLPTGRVLAADGTGFDFRSPRPIGDTVLNTCYLQPVRDADGMLRVRLTSPDGARTVTVWMDKTFDYVVLYSGNPMPEPHRRHALAIEPMTCDSDALNYPDWGLVTLPPGETLSGTWGVEG